MGTKNGVISWNSMIVGFAKNGYAEDALKIFEEMKQSHVEPDDVTFLGVLTACSHAGKVAEGRWGLLKEAEEFIDRLDFVPNSMIWSTLLGACKLHGDDISFKYLTAIMKGESYAFDETDSFLHEQE
ncbi:hypothetical protein M0R45_009654 [Rubus argutus]|uniref:Pentatricopeptide repeat-containing protein n=1 Tax=Rubus argutus TaxID=59490 RepID=A0AAW1Y7P8_RUBAR